MRVNFRIFQSSFSSWKVLFQEAADFAGTIAPDHLITISHSADKGDGIVCVWFWEDEPEDTAPAPEA